MDIAQITPGHTLVVPNRHADNLADLEPQIGGLLFQTGMKVARAIRGSGLPCEGINLFLADGAAASQTVFHVHLHVIPRFAGDGFRIQSPNLGSVTERNVLEDRAALIRKALGRLT